MWLAAGGDLEHVSMQRNAMQWLAVIDGLAHIARSWLGVTRPATSRDTVSLAVSMERKTQDVEDEDVD